MKKIAVIFHSAHGHTEHIAHHVFAGARSAETAEVDLLRADDLRKTPEDLVGYDGFVLGSPTYLGGVSGRFKCFMDATGGLWRTQRLKGKLAGGFTVSALPSGDKQSTLMSMFVFSMQHGMIWVGNPFLPEQRTGATDAEATNRLGSWSGLMAQARHGPAAGSFVDGDLESARMFGRYFAQTLDRVAIEASPGALS